MLIDLAYIAVGLVVLIAAGDALVRGAVACSLRFGLSPMIVSATVVAFGTSAPELLISVNAALDGAPGIALGNVVGSNIANVWLVLGVPALIAPLAGCGSDAHRSTWYMIGATVLFTGLVMTGEIGRIEGLVLLAFVGLMVGDSVRQALAARNGGTTVVDEEALAEIEDVDPHMPGWKIAGLMLVGIVGLPLGADLLVDGAKNVAAALGVSETVIGLTVVAIGTSLPELATTVVAAMRGQADVAIGNVVGSNIFNLTAIIGAAAVVAPMQVPAEILTRDLWIMILATVTLLPFILFCKRICRITGALYLTAYAAFIGYAAITAIT